jgi:hypothetical protein
MVVEISTRNSKKRKFQLERLFKNEVNDTDNPMKISIILGTRLEIIKLLSFYQISEENTGKFFR